MFVIDVGVGANVIEYVIKGYGSVTLTMAVLDWHWDCERGFPVIRIPTIVAVRDANSLVHLVDCKYLLSESGIATFQLGLLRT